MTGCHARVTLDCPVVIRLLLLYSYTHARVHAANVGLGVVQLSMRPAPMPGWELDPSRALTDCRDATGWACR